MYKQYVFLEELENGAKVRYTFETKKQLLEFLEVLDTFNFTIKEEWTGLSI